MPSKANNDSKYYCFGSAIVKKGANDFDLLIIYNEEKCDPANAYLSHNDVISEIRDLTNLPIHTTMLTEAEANNSDIFSRTSAIDLATGLKLYCKLNRGILSANQNSRKCYCKILKKIQNSE